MADSLLVRVNSLHTKVKCWLDNRPGDDTSNQSQTSEALDELLTLWGERDAPRTEGFVTGMEEMWSGIMLMRDTDRVAKESIRVLNAQIIIQANVLGPSDDSLRAKTTRALFRLADVWAVDQCGSHADATSGLQKMWDHTLCL